MSVSSISSAIGLIKAEWNKVGKQDFSQILEALQSGNLPEAKKAYATMKQVQSDFQVGIQAAAKAGNSSSSESAALNSPESSNPVAASNSFNASLTSIYNMDGSLKTRQQWNADRASVVFSAAEKAQLDAAHINSLRPYISLFAYQTSVQNNMLMNDIDTAGMKITSLGSFGPSAITQHQADLFSQAKRQGENPTNPTDLLDMLGISRRWS